MTADSKYCYKHVWNPDSKTSSLIEQSLDTELMLMKMQSRAMDTMYYRMMNENARTFPIFMYGVEIDSGDWKPTPKNILA